MATYTTPGTLDDPISVKSSLGKITLSSTSTRPLSPVGTVSNTLKDDGSTWVNISCIIFVSEGNMPLNSDGAIDTNKDITFDINFETPNDSTTTLNFYVSRKDSFIPSDTFYPFVINIGFNPLILNPNITTLASATVYNWDADPDGSRGTEFIIPS